MLGYLIYDNEQKEKNRWFINHFFQLSKKHNLNIQLKIVERGEIIQDLPDYAIVRTINRELTEYLSKNGVILFNNLKTSLIANDKYETYQFCKKIGIECMKTELLSNNAPSIPYPFVVKSVDGHGGSEVYLVENERKFEEVKDKLVGKKCIAQEIADTLGVDVRAYLLGGEIVSSIKRYSKKDFRSNYSLGGGFEKTQLTEEQKVVIDKLYKQLNFDYVGIDFIYNNNKWVLNEIEDVVGARMLYKLNEIDILDKYLLYIKNKLKGEIIWK